MYIIVHYLLDGRKNYARVGRDKMRRKSGERPDFTAHVFKGHGTGKSRGPALGKECARSLTIESVTGDGQPEGWTPYAFVIGHLTRLTSPKPKLLADVCGYLRVLAR